MTEKTSRYIDPLTDFGFKHLFGSEPDKDKWFYLLKNLSRLDKIPKFLDKRVFQKVFKIAEVSKLTKEERELYHSDIKAKSDWKAGMDWARKQAAKEAKAEGITQGIAKAKIEDAIKMKEKGFAIEDIADITGLSITEIENL